MLSPWQQESFYFPTEVAIIGAGLTGLQTALLIKKKSPGTSVRILERGSYPSGASVKNAGFACFGSASEILNDIETEGEQLAIERVIKRYRGIQSLRKHTENTDIGYKAEGGFEVFTEAEREIYEKAIEALSGLNALITPELGFEPYSLVKNNFGFHSLPSLIAIRGEASIDSGKLMKVLVQKALSAGIELNFGCDVHEIQPGDPGWVIKSNGGNYSAKKLIVATNGFTQSLLPGQPVLPCRGQVLITSPVEGINLTGTFHLNQGYYYFRNFNGRIMLGGGRHLDRENEITEEQVTSEKIQNALEQLLENTILPGKKFEIEQRWAGILGYGPNNEKEAIVEEIKPNLFIGARLGGMGIAMAPIVAEDLATKVLKESSYTNLIM